LSVGGRTVESFLSQYSDSRDLLASHVSSITIYFNLHPLISHKELLLDWKLGLLSALAYSLDKPL
jgi:hypothetical protein